MGKVPYTHFQTKKDQKPLYPSEEHIPIEEVPPSADYKLINRRRQFVETLSSNVVFVV